MTLKRSRSRSGDDEDDLVQRPPPQSEARRARKSEQEADLNLQFQNLSINPLNDEVNNQPNEPEIPEFLKCCYYCKKRMSLTSEVYMYKDLCAFCSVECRDIHISVDGVDTTDKKDTVSVDEEEESSRRERESDL